MGHRTPQYDAQNKQIAQQNATNVYALIEILDRSRAAPHRSAGNVAGRMDDVPGTTFWLYL